MRNAPFASVRTAPAGSASTTCWRSSVGSCSSSGPRSGLGEISLPWSRISAALTALVAMVLWLASKPAARLWPVAVHARAVLLTGLATALGVLVAVLAAAAVIVGIVIVADSDDDPDSP